MTSASPKRPPGLHPALSQQQGFALLEEALSARNLLRDCIEAIRGMRYVSLQGDAVFTLGSIGVEKAMKIMLGCAEVEVLGTWPTQATLKCWGHDLETLDQRLSAALQGGLSKATSGGYAATLATRIGDSQTLPLIFETFSRYGYLENVLRTSARPGLVQVSGVDALTSGCPRVRVALIWSAPPRTPPGQEWLKRGLNVRK